MRHVVVWPWWLYLLSVLVVVPIIVAVLMVVAVVVLVLVVVWCVAAGVRVVVVGRRGVA